MTIDRSKFAGECVDATVYCGIFSYLHFLVAAAQLRSGISDTNSGEQIGPFRIIQKDWDAYRSDADFEFNYLTSDINIWEMQPHIAALMVYRAQQRLFNQFNHNPSAVELFQDIWPQGLPGSLVNDLTQALASTESLLVPAAKSYFGQDIPVGATPDPAVPPQTPPSGSVNFRRVPNGNEGKALAQKILDKFGQSGFASHQQIAALANAIAESGLNPNAHAARGEDSFGLFQLNRKGGLGAGHSVDELVNPDSNIAIVIKAAQQSKAFTRAASIEDAVAAFVKDVERPSDILGQTKARINIAHKLVV